VSFSYQFPKWFSGFREGQEDAALEAVNLFAQGIRVVFLEAPVGAGKTIVGEAVRQLDVHEYAPIDEGCCYDADHGWSSDNCCSSDAEGGPSRQKHRCVYVATTKSLQDQVVRDFDYCRVIKGRSNYPTVNRPDDFPGISTQDCMGKACDLCPSMQSCTYMAAKRAALAASLVVANTAYLMAEANGARPGFSNLDLLITDEADTLESQIMSYTEIFISERRRRELGLFMPKRKTKPASWMEWISDAALPAVRKAYWAIPESTRDLAQSRRRRGLVRLADQLEMVNLDDGWVYSGYHKDDSTKGDVRFRPIKVDAFANKVYFRHARRHLLMSATIISAQQMAHDLGLADHEWGFVSAPSSFPAARSPIAVRAVADVSRRADEKHKLVPALRAIMQAHPGERILVHTVSYPLTRYLVEALTDPRVMWYDKAYEREATLARFRRTKGAVLLAPSLDRGIDLPHDACRVVVMAKVPFPDLGDKQISARIYTPGGQTWYSAQTIRTIVQMFGRGMRAEDDWMQGYILDSNFVSNVWRRSRHLVPKWFRDRLDWHGRMKPERE
jgi:Rad3-related DNA helicase